MRVLLTGITGNLGYEVFLDLLQRGITVIPCVRSTKDDAPTLPSESFEEMVECDLLEEKDINYSGDIDCIVHCAGIVAFKSAGDKNERMLRTIINFAKRKKASLFFVSTAYTYRPPGEAVTFNNSYEKDKFNAEQLLLASNTAHAILKPSVITGHSRTGAIRNFSGYYLIARAFFLAVQKARENKRVLRFPKMTGTSNMIPVDQVAVHIGTALEQNQLGTIYLTNPIPPLSEWVLNETLNFYNMQQNVHMINTPFQDFGKLSLTQEEAELYHFTSHFNPYWSTNHNFPQSVCTENKIDHTYMMKVLTFFNNSKHHEERIH